MLRAFMPGPDETVVPVDAAAVRVDEAAWVWFDLMPGEAGELADLGRRFGLNRLALEDAAGDTHFPKVDDYDDHIFVVLHGLAEREGRLETSEIDVFLGQGFLITIRYQESPSIDWVLEHGTVGASGPDVLLARLAETSSRRLLPLIEELDQTMDDLEERAIDGDGSIVPDIQALRRDSIRLRRVIGPQRDVLRTLSRPGSRLIGARAQQRFGSAFDHHLRVVENLDAARTLLSSILDSYRGTVAEKMNEVMKVLTVYAAILLPLSLLAGIYGMNFTNMPELQWRWGYFALVGVMAVLAIGQWLYFARRGFVGAFSFRKIPRSVGRGLARLALLPIDAVATVVRGSAREPESKDNDQL